MNLVIDIGNSATKMALFESENLIKKIQHHSLSIPMLETILNDFPSITNCILCSVKNHSEQLNQLLASRTKLIQFDYTTRIPIINKYSTPYTLGKDRLAAAIGANSLFPRNNVLAIDIGTCIKYDFVKSDSEYLGGAISPGIGMRYKALNQFTDKLPLITTSTEEIKLIGTSTEESIRSGVQLGVIAEINGIIHQYEMLYSEIKIVLSGGGSVELQKHLKKDIFASPNLVLYGLNKVLTYNFDS